MCHVPVLDQIAYGNASSTLLHHVFFCEYHKIAMMETGFYSKIFSHVYAQHQHHSEHDITFLYTFGLGPAQDVQFSTRTLI